MFLEAQISQIFEFFFSLPLQKNFICLQDALVSLLIVRNIEASDQNITREHSTFEKYPGLETLFSLQHTFCQSDVPGSSRYIYSIYLIQ